MKNFRRITAGLICGTSLLGFAAPAVAQDDITQDTDAPQEATNSGGLDVIVVTARRKAESLLDVPVAVSAVSAAALERGNVTDLEGMAQMVPQVIVADTPAGNGASFSIRGIGTPSLDPGLEQSVLVMLDGTPITRGRIVLTGMFDLAQLEVLKGPQALFFGKNSPAGVISVTTAGPTDYLDGYFRAGYEFNADEAYMEAAVSGPLTGTLSGRLAVRGSTMKGWLDNIATANLPAPGPAFIPVAGEPRSRRAPGTKELLGRASLKWEPSEDFDATLRVTLGHRSDKVGTGQGFCDPELSSGVATLGGVIDPRNGCTFDDEISMVGMPAQYIVGDWEGARDDGQNYADLDTVFGNLTMNKQIGDVTLTSVSSYWKIKSSSMLSYDWTSYGLAQGANGETTDSLSQELRLVSDFDGPLNFTMGGFYEHLDRRSWSDTFIFFLGPVPQGQPGAGRYDNFHVQHLAGADTYSGFGQLGWALTDTIELTGGVRYTREIREQTSENLFFHPFANGALGPFVPVGDQFEATFKDSNWSPEVALSYKPSTDVLLYAAYKTGYKSGGFPSVALFKLNPDGTIPTGDDFDFGSEKAKGFEVGAKAEVLDRRLRLEFAAYRYDYNDLQQSVFNPETFSFSILNAANARTKGLELQAEFAATPELRLMGSVAYNDARFTTYANSPCYKGQTAAQGCVSNTQDLTGRRLPRAPLWNVLTGFNYETGIGNDLRLGLNGDVAYRSGYFSLETQAPYGYQSGFALWNAGIRLITEDDQLEMALIGRNLTDKYYVDISTSGAFAPTQDQLNGGTPRGREIALQLTYRL